MFVVWSLLSAQLSHTMSGLSTERKAPGKSTTFMLWCSFLSMANVIITGLRCTIGKYDWFFEILLHCFQPLIHCLSLISLVHTSFIVIIDSNASTFHWWVKFKAGTDSIVSFRYNWCSFSQCCLFSSLAELVNCFLWEYVMTMQNMLQLFLGCVTVFCNHQEVWLSSSDDNLLSQ